MNWRVTRERVAQRQEHGGCNQWPDDGMAGQSKGAERKNEASRDEDDERHEKCEDRTRVERLHPPSDGNRANPSGTIIFGRVHSTAATILDATIAAPCVSGRSGASGAAISASSA